MASIMAPESLDRSSMDRKLTNVVSVKASDGTQLIIIMITTNRHKARLSSVNPSVTLVRSQSAHSQADFRRLFGHLACPLIWPQLSTLCAVSWLGLCVQVSSQAQRMEWDVSGPGQRAAHTASMDVGDIDERGELS